MRVWTEEQKQKQREAIQQWAPWKKSTGPRTDSGKQKSSRNSLKHGLRSKTWSFYRSYLYVSSRFTRGVEAAFRDDRRYNRQTRKNSFRTNELLTRERQMVFLMAKLMRETQIFHLRLSKIPAIKGQDRS